MIHRIKPAQLKAYQAMTKEKVKYGVYHKTCFHVHTPASYDYRLLKDWDHTKYSKASDQELYDICVERHVIPRQFLKLDDISYDTRIFSSKKDLLSYLLLADSIAVNEIELILVTDHNTIKGYKKLITAVEQLNKSKPIRKYPFVVLGIEISCADKMHVVGIFDGLQEKTLDHINQWLDDNLISEKDGTYKTSLEVLNAIKEHGGIGYIAHIDTSDIFKETHFSKAYKKKLFSDDSLRIIGTKRYDHIDTIKGYIREYSHHEVKVVLDNDAHDIDTLSSNTFWIKGSRKSFSMIKEALNDYDISISFKEGHINKQFIKGIYIENTSKGFLYGKESEGFCLTFSNALNCIIGGRGTGKSSILEMIEYVLSQRCRNEEMLDFICFHGNTWLLYHFNGDDYLIEMSLPKKGNDSQNILQFFSENKVDHSYPNRKYYYNRDAVERISLQKFVRVYKVVLRDDEIYLETTSTKRRLLETFYDTKYSVNELVNTANSDEINRFILKTLFDNDVLSEPYKIIKCKTKTGLKKTLKDVQKVLEKRKSEVHNTIDPFNSSQEDKLKIVYSQQGIAKEPNIEGWLFNGSPSKKGLYKKYNIRKRNVTDYLLELFQSLGCFDFLTTIINLDIEKAKKEINLLSFCEPLTQELIDKEICEITASNMDEFLKSLFRDLISSKNLNKIISYLKEYVSEMERFDLLFNINNKEGTQGKAILKNVKALSLGQKVVAMFSFILGYSEYANDYRPLIIDQPEDNLDNQYIYKNLVSQLRSINEKRQIIIATHNATIVTNAKADEVCVMNSDNVHGWIERVGYPGEKTIKNSIINYLEGGKDSFKHKCEIYREVL